MQPSDEELFMIGCAGAVQMEKEDQENNGPIK